MNNDIYPCAWFQRNAKQAATFYAKTFNGNITADTPMVMNIEIFGQKLMLLEGGPQFQVNPSISLMVICESENEINNYWNSLIDGGTELMPLDTYPFAKKYGWLKDKYDITWQLFYGETKPNMQRLLPTMMFIHNNNGKARDAMEFYTKIFPNSKLGEISTYGKMQEGSEPENNIAHAQFTLDGYEIGIMDSSHDHKFNFSEGMSMVVMTDDQEETDHFWNSLIAEGGNESMCGWLKDKYGVSWQIVPKKLLELGIFNKDEEKGKKVFQAMLKMKKIIISELEKANN